MSSIISINRRLSHRTITVLSLYFWLQRCATASRFLEYDCSARRSYRCARRARTRRPHTHATSEGSTTLTRLPKRQWSTSKLTEHRWKFSFKSKLCALLHRSCIDQIVEKLVPNQPTASSFLSHKSWVIQKGGTYAILRSYLRINFVYLLSVTLTFEGIYYLALLHS